MPKPSRSTYSHVRIEEATITDSSRARWTVKLDTTYSAKSPEEVEVISPYHHYEYGEGFHVMPEVGARCLLLWPSDQSVPRVIGFVGAPAAVQSTDGQPIRSTGDPQGSATDVTFRSRRPPMNPGDMGFTTRDGNFLYVRRGGVIQLGAGPLCQRIYLPIKNFIRDFAENYSMDTVGGAVEWLTHRQEEDPSGQANCSWTMCLREFAQDQKASVQVRYLAPTETAGSRTAWEVSVAPQNIDPVTKEVSSETYKLTIQLDGEKVEFIKASRSVTIEGDDSLDVSGDRSATIGGTDSVQAAEIEYVASGQAVYGGATVKLVGSGASHPIPLGDQLVNWLATQVWPVATIGGAMVAQPTAAQIAQLNQILSRKAFTE